MAKKNKGLTPLDYGIGIFGVALIAKAFFGKSMTREEAIKILQSAGHTSQNFNSVTDWGTDYLTAWAKGIQKNVPSFRLGKYIYSTKNGTRIA